jgi:hypothetical protein
MATAFGAPAAQALPNSPRWKALRPIAARRCIRAVRAARPSTVCALCFIRPATRPCAALQRDDRRGGCARALRVDDGLPQSCAWAGCGANKAQAPAVGDSATQAAATPSWPMKGRGIARRREFGSSAQRCAERRSHRAAARPRAALQPSLPYCEASPPDNPVLPVAAPTGATVVLGALPLSPSPELLADLPEVLLLAEPPVLLALLVPPGRAGLTVSASREFAPIALADPFALAVDGVTEIDPLLDAEPDGMVSVRACGERVTSAGDPGSGMRAVVSGAR